MTRMLEGEVMPDVDPELERLRADLRKAERERDDAKLEAKRAREDADRALSMLRRQLSPLYRALQAVFGELDAAGVTDDASSPATPPSTTNSASPRQSTVWDAWKQRLSTSCGKIIDALLVHGNLNVDALVVATGISRRQTIYDSISAMKKAGIINKDSAGGYSLKQL